MTGFSSLRLPDRLRPALAEPIGPVLSSPEAKDQLQQFHRQVPPVKVATCGDMVTANVLKWGYPPFIAVVDGKTERSVPMPVSTFDVLAKERHLRVKNKAGGLSAELREAIHKLVRAGGGLLEVEGEEDLAVLSLIMEMAPGTTVIYGQPGRGICMVKVDEDSRSFALKTLSEMEVVGAGN